MSSLECDIRGGAHRLDFLEENFEFVETGTRGTNAEVMTISWENLKGRRTKNIVIRNGVVAVLV